MKQVEELYLSTMKAGGDLCLVTGSEENAQVFDIRVINEGTEPYCSIATNNPDGDVRLLAPDGRIVRFGRTFQNILDGCLPPEDTDEAQVLHPGVLQLGKHIVFSDVRDRFQLISELPLTSIGIADNQ
jgi:hypothetical protein